MGHCDGRRVRGQRLWLDLHGRARATWGPFAVDAPQNDDWEAQIQHVPALFQSVDWPKLQPRDEWIQPSIPPSDERQINGRPAPPERAAWCLGERGEQAVLYLRGMTRKVTLSPDGLPPSYTIRRVNPRSGTWSDLGEGTAEGGFSFRPPDGQDWVVVLQRTGE